MSCLTTNPATSVYLTTVIESNNNNNNNNNFSSDETPASETNKKLTNNIDTHINSKSLNSKIMETENPTIESMSCEAGEFNRPTTPPASTPSPKVNKRKLKNQLFTGKFHWQPRKETIIDPQHFLK